MSKESDPRERLSLSRWSRLKHEAARTKDVPAAVTPAAHAVVPPSAPPVAPAEPLPPVESLTIDSDFTAFLAPKVDEGLKRAALRKLFSDPRFNVMDGLDVYIDDYSKSDPMPDGLLDKLANVYNKLTEEPEKDPAPATETSIAATPAEPPPQEPVAPREPADKT
jgi:hypothetical protein